MADNVKGHMIASSLPMVVSPVAVTMQRPITNRYVSAASVHSTPNARSSTAGELEMLYRYSPAAWVVIDPPPKYSGMMSLSACRSWNAAVSDTPVMR